MQKKKVIPTIFALDKKSFDIKLEKLKFAQIIHIDFMDGKFVSNKSVELNDIEIISDYKNIEFELHLMAYEPEQYIGKIKRLGIKRVLIQFEAFETDTELIYSLECFKDKEIEVFLVINPGTELEDVYSYFDDVKGIMLMSVWPGKEGQKFIENTLNRIKEVKNKYPKYTVQIDGGINDENASKIINSGADILSIGSYISSKENAKENFDKISNLLNN